MYKVDHGSYELLQISPVNSPEADPAWDVNGTPIEWE